VNKTIKEDTMNKKNILTALLLLCTLILTACASSKLSTPTSGATGKLSAQNQLIVGTIRLEETDYAITADQAAKLLPMWLVLKDLNESGSAAQEEMDGLVTQIQGTMTKDQINAIKDMGLTSEDMTALMQSGGGTSSAKAGSTQNATGGGPGGPPPDMPGGVPGMSPSGATSATNKSSSTSQTNSTPSALFGLVIELLQKKV
jgi:hypothetical protein